MGPKELARIERGNALFAAVLILGAVVFFSAPVAIGVTVGAVLAVANFWGVRRLVAASLRTDGMRRAALQLLLIGKMGILLVLVFLAIRYLPLHPVGLAVGMSVFLFSIAVESIRFSMRPHADAQSDSTMRANDGRA